MPRATDTFAFLCGALSVAPTESGDAALQDAIAAQRISWPWLVQLASTHQVASSLAVALARRGLNGDLPEDLRDYFDAVALLNRERNERIRAEALSAGHGWPGKIYWQPGRA